MHRIYADICPKLILWPYGALGGAYDEDHNVFNRDNVDLIVCHTSDLRESQGPRVERENRCRTIGP